MMCGGTVDAGDPHGEQCSDHREVAHAVDEVAPALVRQGDDHAGHARADEARRIEHRRVQGDGIAQIALVLDQRDDERLPAGHVERVDDALEDADDDQPANRNGAGKGQPGKHERDDHRRGLRADQQPVAVPAVDEDSRERGEEERRELRGEADDPQQQRRAGQPIDKPARGRGGDPRPGQRHDLAAEEQPVVAVPEGPQHEPEARA